MLNMYNKYTFFTHKTVQKGKYKYMGNTDQLSIMTVCIRSYNKIIRCHGLQRLFFSVTGKLHSFTWNGESLQ